MREPTEGTVTDASLVARVRAGDREAFGQLAERCQGLAERVALGMLGDRERAREVAQEALIHAYLSIDRLRDAARFHSWLYGIVLNLCRTEIRQAAAGPLSLEALTGGLRAEALRWPEPLPGPEELAEEHDLAERVRAALSALTPADREATWLFYFEALSVREVAALLRISAGAVKTRLHKARRELRGQLWPLLVDEQAYGLRRPEEERVPMIKMRIADVVRQAHTGGPRHVVVLLDETEQRALPIWIGPAEAVGIALAARRAASLRPLAVDFMAKLLAASGAVVEAVEIASLKDDVFYATVRVRHDDRVAEIDARPSDALGLAAVTGAPIYTAEDVLSSAGFAVTLDTEARTGQGIDELLRDFERQAQAMRAEFRQQDREDSLRSCREALAQAFGQGAVE